MTTPGEGLRQVARLLGAGIPRWARRSRPAASAGDPLRFFCPLFPRGASPARTGASILWTSVSVGLKTCGAAPDPERLAKRGEHRASRRGGVTDRRSGRPAVSTELADVLVEAQLPLRRDNGLGTLVLVGGVAQSPLAPARWPIRCQELGLTLAGGSMATAPTTRAMIGVGGGPGALPVASAVPQPLGWRRDCPGARRSPLWSRPLSFFPLS